MRLYQTILAIVALLLLPLGQAMGADPDAPAETTQSADQANAASGSQAQRYLPVMPAPYSPGLAARLGWWGVDHADSPFGVGEWQGLDSSSPFWDIDGLTSDGYQTADFFATGVENDTTQVGLDFYRGPGLSVDAEYDRYLHRQGHDPLAVRFCPTASRRRVGSTIRLCPTIRRAM